MVSYIPISLYFVLGRKKKGRKGGAHIYMETFEIRIHTHTHTPKKILFMMRNGRCNCTMVGWGFYIPRGRWLIV